MKINKKIINDSDLRKRLAYESMEYFFGLYLNKYITYKLAPFHYDFFSLAEDESKKLVEIIAFRGSGKSTYFSTCYPIWAVVGKLQKKFVIIFTRTQQQGKILFGNITRELSENDILKDDIGPFEDSSEEWSAMSIVIKQYNARIMVASVDQSVRGLRFNQYRPDLIILDDVEDQTNIHSSELREKLFRWYTGEVRTIGTPKTKIVIVGTRLHEDDLYSRIATAIKDRKIKGIVKFYPIANSDGKPSWKGKYPNKMAIEEERAKVMDETTWQREYMLRIVYDENYIFRPDDFVHYEILPPKEKIRMTIVAIDLAISKKSTSDKTAFVSAYLTGHGKDIKAYILPMIVNKRLTFNETINEVHNFLSQLDINVPQYLLVENVAYQQAAIEQLQIDGFKVEPVNPQGDNKEARLSAATPLVKNKTILFPQNGAEELERQLVGFGIEDHDDLADAFAYLAKKIRDEIVKRVPSIRVLY